jgi:DNA segregation ATPase FtsK/SpoIIIE-like protein
MSTYEDDLLRRAAEVCYEAGFASATMVQRCLGVSFAQAWDALEQLVRLGVLKPTVGSLAHRLALPDVTAARRVLDAEAAS